MSQPSLPEAQRWTGPHIYKYGFVVDWLEDLILRHQLYIPTVAQLNDPNDSRPRLRPFSTRDLARFATKRRVTQNPELSSVRPELNAMWNRLLATMDVDALYRELVEMMDADVPGRRVYSMSTRWDNLKMWAHYANNHAGYCLEFANDHDDPLFGMARVVIYDASFEMDLTLDEHITPTWYLFKHPDWRCEEEVRIVLRKSFGGPVFNISPHLLTRVILGRCMPPSDVERVREWASKRTPPLEVDATTYDQFTRTFGLA